MRSGPRTQLAQDAQPPVYTSLPRAEALAPEGGIPLGCQQGTGRSGVRCEPPPVNLVDSCVRVAYRGGWRQPTDPRSHIPLQVQLRSNVQATFAATRRTQAVRASRMTVYAAVRTPHAPRWRLGPLSAPRRSVLAFGCSATRRRPLYVQWSRG
jgi:hypothetical protein